MGHGSDAGNTVKTDNGYKTRPFEAVRDEIMAFFEVHEKMGTHPGGVRRNDRSERDRVPGGYMDVSVEDLEKRYLTPL